MTDDSQAQVKKALMQVFDRLSTQRKVEVLEFALFMQARERQESLAKRAGIEDVTSQLRPDSSPSAHPLYGSVLHYDDPFSSVAIADAPDSGNCG